MSREMAKLKKRGARGKFKKGMLEGCQLTQADVSYISSNTSYTEEDIREWFR